MNVLVVGGSGGIGEAVVSLLRRDKHNVSFTYHSGSAAAEAIETL